MKAKTLTIHWHGTQSIYAADFIKCEPYTKLATAGADSQARLWQLEGDTVKFLCTLARHEQSVNCVRWHPN